ncbi:hypothetical protein EsH8_VI_000122 [Colletotrichum jinshuiense]
MSHRNNGNTVHLTEQEAQRIRNTVQERLKQCSARKGVTREPRDPHGTISQATGASLMMDMGTMSGSSQGDTLPALGVGQTYPPCTVSLKDLQPMNIADLLMETHHRGRRLTVKRASPVVTLAARSWAVIQDEEGDGTERIEICLHKATDGKDILESASVFIIKEPYFTLNEEGEATIWIDHPSDMVVCRDEIANSKFTRVTDANEQVKDTTGAEDSARKCKDKGNAALKQQDLPLARARYTEGLKLARQGSVYDTNPDLARDIYRNRAHVNLLLNRSDEAIADAKASLIGGEDRRTKDLDSKAFFRAGCGAYNLGEFQKAKSFFEEAQKLAPGEKGAIIYLRKVEMRLREEATGAYDLKKLRASLSRAAPRADAASFTSKTEVKDSPGRGRGLFATCDIPAGETIMCEKAFCVVWGHESEALTAMTYDVRDDRIRVAPVGLSKATVQKLLRNSSQIEKVMDLYGDYQDDNKIAPETDEGPVVDVFRVHDIVSRNAFGPGGQYGEEGARNASTGLWIWAAYINHSCIANAKKEYVGDLMVLRAVRAISAGEEIFHSYDESSDYETRKAALMTTWGFECSCALCTAEKTDDPAVRKKRQQLATEADEFVAGVPWANTKRLAIAKAQRLAREIDATYEGEKYKGVSRLASQKIRDWLAKATPQR